MNKKSIVPDIKAYKEVVKQAQGIKETEGTFKIDEHILEKTMIECQKITIKYETKKLHSQQTETTKAENTPKEYNAIFAFLEAYVIFVIKEGFFKQNLLVFLLDDLYKIDPIYDGDNSNQRKYVKSIKLYFVKKSARQNNTSDQVDAPRVYIFTLHSSNNFNANHFFFQFTKWTNFIYSSENLGISSESNGDKAYKNDLSRPDIAASFHFLATEIHNLENDYNRYLNGGKYDEIDYDMHEFNKSTIRIIYGEEKEDKLPAMQRILTLHPKKIKFKNLNNYKVSSLSNIPYINLDKALKCIDVTRTVKTLTFKSLSTKMIPKLNMENEFMLVNAQIKYAKDHKLGEKKPSDFFEYNPQDIDHKDFTKIVTDFLLRKTCVRNIIFENSYFDFDFGDFNKLAETKKAEINKIKSITVKYYTRDDVIHLLYHANINSSIEELGLALDPSIEPQPSEIADNTKYLEFAANPDEVVEAILKNARNPMSYVSYPQYREKAMLALGYKQVEVEDQVSKVKKKMFTNDDVIAFVKEYKIPLRPKEVHEYMKNNSTKCNDKEFRSRCSVSKQSPDVFTALFKYIPRLIPNKHFKSFVCTDWDPASLFKTVDITPKPGILSRRKLGTVSKPKPEPPLLKAFMHLKKFSFLRTKKASKDSTLPKITLRQISDVISSGFTDEFYFNDVNALKEKEGEPPNIFHLANRCQLRGKSDDLSPYPSVISIRDTMWDKAMLTEVFRNICNAEGASIFLDLSGATLNKCSWEKFFEDLLQDKQILPTEDTVIESIIGIDLSVNTPLKENFYNFMKHCPRLERLQLRNVIKDHGEIDSLKSLIQHIENIGDERIDLQDSRSIDSSAMIYLPETPPPSPIKMTPSVPLSRQNSMTVFGSVNSNSNSNPNLGNARFGSMGAIPREGISTRPNSLVKITPSPSQVELPTKESTTTGRGLKVLDISNNSMNEDAMEPFIDLLLNCKRLQKLYIRDHLNDSRPELFNKLLLIQTLEVVDVASDVMKLGSIRMLADNVRSGKICNRGRLKIVWPHEMLQRLELRGRAMKILYDEMMKNGMDADDITEKQINDKINDIQKDTIKEYKYIGVSPADIADLYQSIYYSNDLPLSEPQKRLHEEEQQHNEEMDRRRRLSVIPGHNTVEHAGGVAQITPKKSENAQVASLEALEEIMNRRRGLFVDEKPTQLTNAGSNITNTRISNEIAILDKLVNEFNEEEIALINWDMVLQSVNSSKEDIKVRSVAKQRGQVLKSVHRNVQMDEWFEYTELHMKLKDAIDNTDLDKLNELLQNIFANEDSVKGSKFLHQTLPLLYAARSPNFKPEMLEIFERNGADIFGRDRRGDNALIAAAGGGNEALVKHFLDLNFDPNVTNIEGDTPLHEAVRANHPRICELLRDAGADRSIANRQLKTPVSLAKESPKNEEVLEILTATKTPWKSFVHLKGELPHKEDKITPEAIKAFCPSDRAADVMTFVNAMPTLEDGKAAEETIIQREESGPYVEMLRNAIVATVIPGKAGKKSRDDERRKLAHQSLRCLLGLCNIEARAYNEVPALILACEVGSPEAILEIINAGAEVNARGRNGETPLMILAARKFDSERYQNEFTKRYGEETKISEIDNNQFMELHNALFGLGANIWAQDMNGRSILHTPGINKDPICDGKTYYNILIELGANCFVVDADGQPCEPMRDIYNKAKGIDIPPQSDEIIEEPAPKKFSFMKEAKADSDDESMEELSDKKAALPPPSQIDNLEYESPLVSEQDLDINDSKEKAPKEKKKNIFQRIISKRKRNDVKGFGESKESGFSVLQDDAKEKNLIESDVEGESVEELIEESPPKEIFEVKEVKEEEEEFEEKEIPPPDQIDLIEFDTVVDKNVQIENEEEQMEEPIILTTPKSEEIFEEKEEEKKDEKTEILPPNQTDNIEQENVPVKEKEDQLDANDIHKKFLSFNRKRSVSSDAPKVSNFNASQDADDEEEENMIEEESINEKAPKEEEEKIEEKKDEKAEIPQPDQNDTIVDEPENITVEKEEEQKKEEKDQLDANDILKKLVSFNRKRSDSSGFKAPKVSNFNASQDVDKDEEEDENKIEEESINEKVAPKEEENVEIPPPSHTPVSDNVVIEKAPKEQKKKEIKKKQNDQDLDPQEIQKKLLSFNRKRNDVSVFNVPQDSDKE